MLLSRRYRQCRGGVNHANSPRPEAAARDFVRNAEIVEGDFSQTETLTRALRRGSRCASLLIPSSSQVEKQQRGFVDSAKRIGVRHIVKELSHLGAGTHSPRASSVVTARSRIISLRSRALLMTLPASEPVPCRACSISRSAISSQGTPFGAARNAKSVCPSMFGILHPSPNVR